MERVGLQPGTDVGGYTIVAPLGSGGMGHVYRAVDGGGVAVALKLLHPHIGADPEARERLRREVVALQRLRHPAVASVLDAEADSTEAFIVTELVDGPTLEEDVRRGGPLDAEALADLADGLDEALDAVHRAGVVHRDLKPSNVLVTREGPVLIDFGIAQGAGDARVTSSGLVVGTPGYLAPELLDGADPTPTSDRWGMAALLAFAATGRDPFGIRPVEVVLARARTGKADLAGLGPGTAALLRAALDPDPARRPEPRTLVEGLREIAVGGEPDDADADPGTARTSEAATVRLAAPPSAPPAGVRAPVGRAQHDADDLGDGDAAVEDVAQTAVMEPTWLSQDNAPVHDGSTRVLEVGALRDGVVDDAGWEGDGGYGAAGAVEEEDAYAPPEPIRRRFVVAVLALVVVCFAAWFPGTTAIVVAVLLVLLHAVDSGAGALEERRARRGGARRGDGARAVLAAPWHLVRGLVLALPSLVVGASVAVLLGGGLWWLLDTGRLVLPAGGAVPGGRASGIGIDTWAYVAVVALGALAGLVAAWSGRLSRGGRRGARRVLGRVAPGPSGTAVVVGLALAAVAVLAGLALTGQSIVWWPLPEPAAVR